MQADPTEQTLLNNLTVAPAYQNRLEEAEATFRKITGEAPESYPKYVHLATAGLLEFRRGNVAAGRALYQEAEQRAPREKKSRVLIYWAREELDASTGDGLRLSQEAAERATRDGDAHTTAYSDESERLIRRSRTPGPMMAITVGAKRREWSVAR